MAPVVGFGRKERRICHQNARVPAIIKRTPDVHLYTTRYPGDTRFNTRSTAPRDTNGATRGGMLQANHCFKNAPSDSETTSRSVPFIKSASRGETNTRIGDAKRAGWSKIVRFKWETMVISQVEPS